MTHEHKKIAVTPSMLVGKQFFLLKKKVYLLDDVVVKARPIRQQGDTINYLASAYIKPNMSTLEDLIESLPGLEVVNGSIHYQGKKINKFYLEGLDLLDNNYSLATNNVRANDISRIEVYERYEPVKVLKKTSTEDRASLNIRLKKSSLNKLKGHLGASLGAYANKKDLLYSGDLYGMKISPKVQNIGTAFSSNYDSPKDKLLGFSYTNLVDGLLPMNPFPEAPIENRLYKRRRHDRLVYGHIRKLNADSDFKYYLEASKHHATYEMQSRTKYYLPDGNTELNEQVQSLSENKAINAEMRYQKNADKRYLVEHLQAALELRSADINIHQNDLRPFSQMAELKNFSLSNLFTFRGVNKKGNMSSFQNQMDMSVVPGYKLYVPEEMSKYYFDESLKAFNFHTYFSGSYAHTLLPLLELVANSSTDLYHQNLISDLNEATTQNNTKLSTIFNSNSLGLNYYPGKMKIKISLPLNFRYLYGRYLDKTNKQKNLSRLIPTWGIVGKLSAPLSPELSMSASVSFNTKTNDGLRKYLLNPLRGSYRYTFIPGDANTDEKSTFAIVHLGADYKYPLWEFFSSLDLSYSHVTSNKALAARFDDVEQTDYLIDRENGFDLFNYSLFASKRLRLFNAIIKARVLGVYTHNLLFRNEQSFENTSYGQISNLEASLDPFSFLSLSIKGIWEHHQSWVKDEPSIIINDISLHSKVSIMPIKQLFINYEMVQYYNSQGGRKLSGVDAPLSNLSLRHKWKNWELDAHINNIFNAETFWQQKINNFDFFFRSYALCPRAFGVGLTYIF